MKEAMMEKRVELWISAQWDRTVQFFYEEEID